MFLKPFAIFTYRLSPHVNKPSSLRTRVAPPQIPHWIYQYVISLLYIYSNICTNKMTLEELNMLKGLGYCSSSLPWGSYHVSYTAQKATIHQVTTMLDTVEKSYVQVITTC